MAKPNLLIVGAGGVGQVTANKAVQFRDDFGVITFAARTQSKLETIAADIQQRWRNLDDPAPLNVRTVDARNVGEMTALIRELDIGLMPNVASPYRNATILDACLETGVPYLDTVLAEDEFTENIDAPWYDHIEWPRRPKFTERGVSAVLGMGFDPGVVNTFCAHVRKHLLDEIDTLDIIDVTPAATAAILPPISTLTSICARSRRTSSPRRTAPGRPFRAIPNGWTCRCRRSGRIGSIPWGMTSCSRSPSTFWAPTASPSGWDSATTILRFLMCSTISA